MKEKNRTFYTYILRCRDNSLYTGYTVDDLEARINKHNQGIGGSYTNSRKPVELVYYETYDSKSLAMKREIEIKKLKKEKKEELIRKKNSK